MEEVKMRDVTAFGFGAQDCFLQIDLDSNWPVSGAGGFSIMLLPVLHAGHNPKHQNKVYNHTVLKSLLSGFARQVVPRCPTPQAALHYQVDLVLEESSLFLVDAGEV